MTDAVGMVAVHVGHDHPAHIERIEAQRLELGANLFFRLDPAAPATLQDGMPPGLIAGIACMRAFSGIDNDQAFWMFDQPAANGKRGVQLGSIRTSAIRASPAS